MVSWIVDNWFDLLSAVGIIGGLFFTAHSLRSETKTRRISNLIALTANHREIWQEFIQNPRLGCLLNPSLDVSKHPVTPEERMFINIVLFHTNNSFEMLKDELLKTQEGVRRDVGSFFSLPLPSAVWQITKKFQNKDFVAFVEQCKREVEGH